MIERSVQTYGRLLMLHFLQHQPSPWLHPRKVPCLVTGPGVETGHDRQPPLFDRD